MDEEKLKEEIDTEDNSEKESNDMDIIIFSEQKSIKSMNDSELVNYLDTRFSDMSSATIRKEKEKDRTEADKQFTALSVRDQYNNLMVNIPLEQNLIDTYEGRASGKLTIDIQPDGKQADVDELQPAQYATEFYLEWGDNKGNGFYDEAPIIRRQKARYGTGFSFVWLENKKQIRYKFKDWAEIDDVDDLEDEENYEPFIMDARELFPKHIPIRTVYVDEKALGQTNLQEAEDIIVDKMMSLNKINFIRGKNKGYHHIDELQETYLLEAEKSNKDLFAKNQVRIRFYYNLLSKDYIIYSPDSKVIIHKSKMLFNHWKFPMEAVQHYSDENCMYGIGVPKKIKYLKGFKSEIMQSILDNASMSSWLNFVLGNDGEVDNRDVGGNRVNVRRTSVGAEEIKQIQPQINTGLIAILNIIDDLIVQDTGENIRATVDVNSDKVGIVEMMEENKAIRHKSVDENWNIFLDKILTMMLSNIAQFVPNLMSRTTVVKQWDKEVTKIEYPYIRIKNATVKKDKSGKYIVDKEDNYGKYWYMELKPGSIEEGLWVKVVTPSTTTTLPLVRKDNITKWIDNKLKMAQLAALDSSWKLMQDLRNSINITELNDWMNDVYWFDDKLKSQTGKDKIKKENQMKIEELRQMIEVNNDVSMPQDNVLPTNPQNAWQNTWIPGTNPPEAAPIIG